MEFAKPTCPTLIAATCTAVACVIGTLGTLSAGEPAANGSLAKSEASRRSAAVEESQELLRKGDEAYQAGRYAEAVEAYAGARDLIPDAPVSAELRAAATERYAQASVEQARMLSRKGDVAGAKAVMDKVLAEGVAPNDPRALAFRAELDDPIRTNPALTAEHAKDVDFVRRLLYTANGAYDLGKFDEADKHFEEVLRIDPTNTAARRGMEKVASAKSDYQKSARDHTRSELLGQVEAAWELKVPAPDLGDAPEDPGGPATVRSEITVKAKIDRIIIPKITLEQATLDEALELLRLRASENDTFELDPARKGVNFAVNLGPADSESANRIRKMKFDLQLSQVPLSKILKYITDITHTSFTTDDFSVVITPAGSSSDELIRRTYRVPPDFISNLSTGEGAAETKEDPFAAAPSKNGLLTKRLSAQEALAKQGVTFPAGASVSYSPSSNTLQVVNTAINQDYVAQLIDAMSQTEPVVVSVRVTMIRTQKTNLDELGFDWLINPFALNSGGTVFAGGGTPGNTPGRTGGDFVSPVNGVAVDGVPANSEATVQNGVVTNGLRSGDRSIIAPAGIDGLLNNLDRGAQQSSVAPGVLALTGLFSDAQVQMVLRGLNQKKSVDIMAQPSTVTRSGQASTISILHEFIYPSEYEPPELPNSGGGNLNNGGFQVSIGPSMVLPATPTAFETKEVGISLEVLPVADANKRFVDITLNPSFSQFDGFVNYGSPINSSSTSLLGGTQSVQLTQNAILMPVFSVQKLATQLTVADGSTIVIGGLLDDRIQDVEDSVPVLGSLPVVGRLFQTKGTQKISTAIIFLVRVELLDPTGRPYRDR